MCRGVHRVTDLVKFPVRVSKYEAFVVFLCYRPPRDVSYRELDDEVGVGRVARTFVTRKDKKSLVITEVIIHKLSLNPMVYS